MDAWLYRLQEIVPDAPWKEETEKAHYAYMGELLADGRLILSGSIPEPLTGTIIFESADEDQAREVMMRDPLVTAGVMRPTLHGFYVGCLRGGTEVNELTQG